MEQSMRDRYARDVTNRFPYPIAAPFARLRTDECMDPGPMRLKYILATGEAIARFCGILVLCECRATLEEDAAEQHPETLGRDLPERLRTPSWGGRLQLARDGLKWLRSQDLKPLCCDLSKFMLDQRGKPSASIRAMDQLLEIRNDLSHHKRSAQHPHEFERLCEQSYTALAQVLEGLEFLMDYELTFVSEIHVHKRRRHNATFHHRFKVFGGESDTFSGERESRPRYCESGTIIIRDLDSGIYLNLDPFLVYDEQTGKAPDVFFFNGMKRSESSLWTPMQPSSSATSCTTLVSSGPNSRSMPKVWSRCWRMRQLRETCHSAPSTSTAPCASGRKTRFQHNSQLRVP